MSSILKALRRLEKDRETDIQEAVRLPREALVEPGEPLVRERAPLSGPLVFGLATAVGLLAGSLWWWGAREPAEPAPAEALASAPSEAPVAARPASPPVAAIPPAPPVAAVQPAPPAPAAPSTAAVTALPAATPPVASPAPVAARPPAEAPAVSPAAPPAPPPVATEKAEARSVASPPPARIPVPSRQQIPDVAVAAPPPEVDVVRTIWHPDAARRTATVRVGGRAEPVELREGDAVGTLVVASIEPSGVVFLHDGRELRRAVGGRR